MITLIKKIIKYLGLGIVILIMAVMFISTQSYKTKYECTGKSSGEYGDYSKLYLELEEYLSWLDIKSYGNIVFEIPGIINYVSYRHIEKNGHMLKIYPAYSEPIKGDFSLLSKRLVLDTHFGIFRGTCKEL
jgi:hypothetical protein